MSSATAGAFPSRERQKQVNADLLYAHERRVVEDAKDAARAALRRRYDLQRAACHCLPHERALQGCQRWVAFGKDAVTLCSYPALKKGRIEGLQSCSSPWACPVCSAKISVRRCDRELTPALATAKAKGWLVLFVTWTVPHQQGTPLLDVLAALGKARDYVRSGGAWTRLRKKFGVEGSIRALEVTYGKNGWHPHHHELIFLDPARCYASALGKDGKVDTLALLVKLRERWDLGAAKAKLPAVSEDHGVTLSETYKDIQKYIAKFGRDPKWGVAQEMSRQQVKKAKAKKGLSPFQLLGIVADGEVVGGLPTPAEAKELFREYAAAMKSSHQLRWTPAITVKGVQVEPGLKEKLGIVELTDAEVEALYTDRLHREVVAELDVPAWNLLRADGQNVPLLSLLAEGDRAGVDALIEPYLPVRQGECYGKMDPADIRALVRVEGLPPLRTPRATLHFPLIHPFDPEDPFSDPRDEENRSLLDLTGGRYSDPLNSSLEVQKFLGHFPYPGEIEQLRVEDEAEVLFGGRGHPLFIHLRALGRLTDRENKAEAAKLVTLPPWLHRAYRDLQEHTFVSSPWCDWKETMTHAFYSLLTDKEYFLLCDYKAQFVQPLRAYAAPEPEFVYRHAVGGDDHCCETAPPSAEPAPGVVQVVSRKGRRLLHRTHKV